MKRTTIVAAAGALTAASLEVLLPDHPFLPSSIERWGAQSVLLAAAVEGALVFLLFGLWLPTEAPWRERPPDPEPDPEGAHHLARRIVISVPLLVVYLGQRFVLGTGRVSMALADTLDGVVGGLVCDGSEGCRTTIATLFLLGINLVLAFCLMAPVWWAEAEAASSWDRHHPHHGPHPRFWS